MSKSQKIQVGFFLAAILIYSLFIPGNSPEKWQGVDLPFSVLESRMQWCGKNRAYAKGCHDALAFLEQQLSQEERKKLKGDEAHPLARFEELRSMLQKRNSKEAELVAGALNAWMSAFDPYTVS